MGSTDVCRICFEPGQYDIFNDELCFNEKSTNKTKIYIVLNNFLFEKLYSQDEFSSLICEECCESLCKSYSFMISVRKAEQVLRFATMPDPPKTPSTDTTASSESKKEFKVIKYPEPKDQNPEEEILHEVQEEVEYNDQEELEEQEPPIKAEQEDELYATEPQAKKQRTAVLFHDKKYKIYPDTTVRMPDSIVFTHYELQQESDPLDEEQTVIILSVTPKHQTPTERGNYHFDTSWIYSDEYANKNTIFKCKYCVKAFSNAEFLLKHTLSSHLCLICLETVENYKELNKHSKQHSNIVCHFCEKSCLSPSNFRQHLKKQHILRLPNHIGIISESSLIQ